MPEPQWLRFHAYLVGLPKTGSSTLAAILAGYRTRHEWDMLRLLDLGARLRAGSLSAEEFARAAGPRLFPPRLEFDDATCHHLYAEVLVQHFPRARYVLTVRDPLAWANSMVDMALRQRLLLQRYAAGEVELGGAYDHYAPDGWGITLDACPDPTTEVAGLLRVWGAHVDRMLSVLPPNGTLVLRTDQLDDAALRLASFLGVDPTTLREVGTRNPAPVRIDHIGGSDPAVVREALAQHCAPGVDALAPEWEAAMAARLDAPGRLDAYRDGWPGYAAAVGGWLDRVGSP